MKLIVFDNRFLRITHAHTHTHVIAYAALYGALDSFEVVKYIVNKHDNFLLSSSSL